MQVEWHFKKVDDIFKSTQMLKDVGKLAGGNKGDSGVLGRAPEQEKKDLGGKTGETHVKPGVL